MAGRRARQFLVRRILFNDVSGKWWMRGTQRAAEEPLQPGIDRVRRLMARNKWRRNRKRVSVEEWAHRGFGKYSRYKWRWHEVVRARVDNVFFVFRYLLRFFATYSGLVAGWRSEGYAVTTSTVAGRGDGERHSWGSR